MQNPSDPTATYDAHKGPGYQVQIAETCSPENEVQLITGALPQSAASPTAGRWCRCSISSAESKLLPEAMLADTLYSGDENMQAAATRGVEFIAPIPGCEPEIDPAALTLDDFAVDKRTGRVEACPQGHAPLVVERDKEAGTTRIEMAPEVCGDAPSATPARSTRLETAATPWNSPTRPIAWLGGGGNKRLRCLRSGTRDARASSRPTAA